MGKGLSRYQTKLRECRLKTKYHNPDDAKGAAVLLRLQSPGHEIDAYNCRWCGGWHIGHRIGNPVSPVLFPEILHFTAPGFPGRKLKITKKSRDRKERKILYREYAKQDIDDGE